MIYVFGLIEQECPKKIMQFLFQKLLKHSDVGTFGIIMFSLCHGTMPLIQYIYFLISYKMFMNSLLVDFVCVYIYIYIKSSISSFSWFGWNRIFLVV